MASGHRVPFMLSDPALPPSHLLSPVLSSHSVLSQRAHPPGSAEPSDSSPQTFVEIHCFSSVLTAETLISTLRSAALKHQALDQSPCSPPPCSPALTGLHGASLVKSTLGVVPILHQAGPSLLLAPAPASHKWALALGCHMCLLARCPRLLST